MSEYRPELRAYAFVNQYIAGIHAGIQTAHAIVEMFNKDKTQQQSRRLEEWAKDHKTIIVLDGGYQSRLEALEEKFRTLSTLELPYASFRETNDALNGAMTALVIVVPDFIYKYDVDENSGYYFDMDTMESVDLSYHERLLAEEIRQYRLKGA